MRILLVPPMVPDPDGSGAIPVLLHAELLGLQRASRGDAGDGGRRRAGRSGGGRAAARSRSRSTSPTAAGRPPGRAGAGAQLRMAARWARGRWPWRTVWFADPGIQRLLDRARRRARLRRRRGRGQRDVGLPLPGGRPDASSPTTRCCGRARSHWRPGPPSSWPGWAFGELDWRRWASFQRAGLAAASTASRSSAAATPRRSPSWRPELGGAGAGQPLRPGAAAGRRPRPARCPGRCSSSATSPIRRTATRPVWLARRDHARGARAAPRARGCGSSAAARRRRCAPWPAPAVEVVADAPSVLPAPRSSGGGDGAGADRRRDADEGAAGDGRRQGGGDDPARDRGLHRLRRGAAAGGRRRARRRSRRRRRRCSGTTSGGARSGERAREFAQRHHSPEAWAARLTAVYEEATRRGGWRRDG